MFLVIPIRIVLIEMILFWRSSFLKKKVAGFPLQSFLKKKRIFTSILNAALAMN